MTPSVPDGDAERSEKAEKFAVQAEMRRAFSTAERVSERHVRAEFRIIGNGQQNFNFPPFYSV